MSDFQPRRVVGVVSDPGDAAVIAAGLVTRQHQLVGEVFCVVLPGSGEADVADLLHLGIDPELTTLFRLAHVPEVAELAAILGEPGPAVDSAAAVVLALQATDVVASADGAALVDVAAVVATSWNERFAGCPLAVPNVSAASAPPHPEAGDDAAADEADWAARPDDLEDVLRYGARRVRREVAATLEAVRAARGGLSGPTPAT